MSADVIPFTVPCVRLELIAAFVEHRLHGAERDTVVEHLEACDQCRELAIEVADVSDRLRLQQRGAR